MLDCDIVSWKARSFPSLFLLLKVITIVISTQWLSAIVAGVGVQVEIINAVSTILHHSHPYFIYEVIMK